MVGYGEGGSLSQKESIEDWVQMSQKNVPGFGRRAFNSATYLQLVKYQISPNRPPRPINAWWSHGDYPFPKAKALQSNSHNERIPLIAAWQSN
jgi:hypothetical protein